MITIPKVNDFLNQKILDYCLQNQTDTYAHAVEMILHEYFELKSQPQPQPLSAKAQAVLDTYYNGLSPLKASEHILEKYSDLLDEIKSLG